MQKNRNSSVVNFGVLDFCLFYTLNFVWNITKNDKGN